MKLLITYLLGLSLLVSCKSDPTEDLIQKEYESKIGTTLEKSIGKNKYSKSLINYMIENSSFKILSKSDDNLKVEIEVSAPNKEVMTALHNFAIISNTEKHTVDDAIQLIEKDIDKKITQLEPFKDNFTCIFLDQSQLKTCNF